MLEAKCTLQHRYTQLTKEREPYLKRARDAAKLTIPTLIPEDDCSVDTASRQFAQAHQSMGADGVNNLSAKLSLTMLPPNDTFYKFDIDRIQLKAEAEGVGADPEALDEQITQNLTKIEGLVQDTIEQDGDRVVVGEAAKHLLVGGNVLLIDVKDFGLKYFPLSRYVVKRDYVGNLLEAITLECIGFNVLPEGIKEQIIAKSEQPEGVHEKSYQLYTGFIREGKKWKVYQEVEGIIIEETQGSYPIDTCPCIPLRYTRIDGESYGRGFIEDCYGDLKSLDDLCKCINDASLAAARLFFLVNPTGVTKIRTLARTENCQFAVGRAEDVSAVQTNKYNDLQVASERISVIEKRLSRIFVLASAVTRDAERVTAEEIRYLKSQLEEALGNTYSILLQEFQRPYLKLKFFHLRKSKRDLPDLMRDKNVKLTITTGVQALGRTAEIQKMDVWFSAMGQVSPLAQALNLDMRTIGTRYAQGVGLNIDNFFIDQATLDAQQQEAQMASMVDKGIAPFINQMGKMANTEQIEQFKQAEAEEMQPPQV